MSARLMFPFKPHMFVAMFMFLFIVYAVMQNEWKVRVLMLVPVTVLFVVFVAAFAWGVREVSAEAVREYKKKENAKGRGIATKAL